MKTKRKYKLNTYIGIIFLLFFTLTINLYVNQTVYANGRVLEGEEELYNERDYDENLERYQDTYDDSYTYSEGNILVDEYGDPILDYYGNYLYDDEWEITYDEGGYPARDGDGNVIVVPKIENHNSGGNQMESPYLENNQEYGGHRAETTNYGTEGVKKEIIVDLSDSDRRELGEVFRRTNDSLGNPSEDNKLLVTDKAISRRLLLNKKDEDFLVVLSHEGNKIEVNTTNIQNGKSDDVQKVFTAFFEAVEKSSLTRGTKSNIKNRLSKTSPTLSKIEKNVDYTNAAAVNIFEGYVIINSVFSFIRTAMGLFSIVTVIFLTISTVLDCMFLGLPVFRGKINEISQGNVLGKVPFITNDAIKTVHEVEQNLGMSENIYLAYFKRRYITYIVFFVCLTYLVIGGPGDFVNSIMDIVDRILN